jgi:hypothetical protein
VSTLTPTTLLDFPTDLLTLSGSCAESFRNQTVSCSEQNISPAASNPAPKHLQHAIMTHEPRYGFPRNKTALCHPADSSTPRSFTSDMLSTTRPQRCQTTTQSACHNNTQACIDSPTITMIVPGKVLPKGGRGSPTRSRQVRRACHAVSPGEVRWTGVGRLQGQQLEIAEAGEVPMMTGKAHRGKV